MNKKTLNQLFIIASLSPCFMVGGAFATTNNRTLVLAQNDSREQFVPYFMKRAVTYDDLKSLSRHEIDIVRNEIYARHGYIFKKKEWDTYFSKQTWYFPKYEDKDFSDSFFTPVQKQNIEFIVNFAKNPSNAQAAANPQATEGEKITGFITNLNNREPLFYLLRPVNANDVQGLPKNDLDIMRNEIYARAGYIFQKKEWNDYFTAQSWYRPRFTSSNFKENFLSAVQKQNVEFIVSFTKTLTSGQPTAEVKPMNIPPIANIGDIVNQGLKIITGQAPLPERQTNNPSTVMAGGNSLQNYVKTVEAIPCGVIASTYPSNILQQLTSVPRNEWGTAEIDALADKIRACNIPNAREYLSNLNYLRTASNANSVNNKRVRDKKEADLAAYQREEAIKKEAEIKIEADKKAKHDAEMAPILAAKAEEERKQYEAERPAREKAQKEAEEKARLEKIEKDIRGKEHAEEFDKKLPSCIPSLEAMDIIQKADKEKQAEKIENLYLLSQSNNKNRFCSFANEVIEPFSNAIALNNKCYNEAHSIKEGILLDLAPKIKQAMLNVEMILNSQVQPIMKMKRLGFCGFP